MESYIEKDKTSEGDVNIGGVFWENSFFNEERGLGSIYFSSTANPKVISEHSLQLLSSILQEENILIISTNRSAYDQARIMYDNIISTGVDNQLKIYGSAGDSVINVFSSNLSREENIQKMAEQILSIGPSRVSRHCSDYTNVNVMDIAKSSINDIDGFKNRLREVGIYFLDENGCIHIEIKQ